MTFEKYVREYINDYLGFAVTCVSVILRKDINNNEISICVDSHNNCFIYLRDDLYDRIKTQYEKLEYKKEYVKGLEKALQIVQQSYSKFCKGVTDYNVHHHYHDVIHELRKESKI